MRRKEKSNCQSAIIKIFALAFIFFAFIPQFALGQTNITKPIDEFGFNIGDDYTLINYTQMINYWKKLAKESPRMMLENIGKTEEGRDQIMAIITAPENFTKLDYYKSISRKLALGENLTDAEAKQIASEGKAVIWIDGSLHATEVVAAEQLIETVYQLVSQNDPETLRFLNDLIILAVPANPDGMELVANWYMRNKNPKKRSKKNLPRLYQKYIGHDNNRDFFMNTQSETINMSRIMYIEWFPQIMYNHHQTGPADLIVFVPPFRDPPNYNYDPILNIGIQSVGLAMHNRLISKNMDGSGMRNKTNFSAWYNGSLRTTGYFHNQIGILTEINGNPAPKEMKLFPSSMVQTNDCPLPLKPRTLHFKEAINYSVELNRALFDYASRNKDLILYNRYLMAKNAIEKGSKDSWTIHPKIAAEVQDSVEAIAKKEEKSFRGAQKKYMRLFKKKENRDPRGYIFPANQPDFPTAVKLVNALMKSGIFAHQATDDFEVNGKHYPKGSLIIKCAQAFRPQIIDMMEPQYYPNDFKYKGGPPNPPYDNAGYTLSLQMNVKYDKILEAFDGPFKKLSSLAKPLTGKITKISNPKGYLLSYQYNDAVKVVNQLLKKGYKVFWLNKCFNSENNKFSPGTFYISYKRELENELKKAATELGVSFLATDKIPKSINQIKKPRIALWDRYGGSISSGWIRWLLEQYSFDFELVFPKTLDKTNLNEQFDVLILPKGAIPKLNGKSKNRYSKYSDLNKSENIPEKYRYKLGRISKKTIANLKRFVENGGTIIALQTSVNIAKYFNLPLKNHLVNINGEPLKQDEFFIPSSILKLKINNSLPIAYGLDSHVNIMFNRSAVFRTGPNAEKQGIQIIGIFDSDTPLLSGWAWGENQLYGGTPALKVAIGKGNLYLFSPNIISRTQSHGTFKFLFNGIYLSTLRK